MDYTMDMLVNKGILPYFAAKEMLWDCEVCGQPIIYNEALTSAKCVNYSCKGRMAAFATAIAADLGYKYLGYNTFLKILQIYNLDSYLDVFSKEFISSIPPGSNRGVDLLREYTATPIVRPFYTIFKYLFLPGMQSEWESVVGTARTIEEVDLNRLPSRYSKVIKRVYGKRILSLHKIEYLFNFVYAKTTSIIEVMITGSVQNFRNKDAFISYLNQHFGDLYTFKQVGKKKSSHICICDTYGADNRPYSQTPKYRIAKECRIPIIFSKELIEVLTTLKNRKRVMCNDI